MPEQMSGGCACGRIRYSASVAPDEAYLCHCRMCQRATGGVSIAFVNLKKAALRWETEPVARWHIRQWHRKASSGATLAL